MRQWKPIAAVVALGAIGLGIYSRWTGTPARLPLESIALAEVGQRALQAETMTCTIHEHWGSADLMIKRPHRVRGEHNGQVHIVDREAQRMLQLDSRTKQARYLTTSGVVVVLDDLYGWLRTLADAQASDQREGVLNGQPVIVFSTMALLPPGSANAQEREILVWVDPQTRLPLQLAPGDDPNNPFATDIRFGVELDDALFDLVVPEGYTLVEEDAAHSQRLDTASADPIEVYAVNQPARAFAEGDFSTPEAAFGNIQRAAATNSLEAWRQVSNAGARAVLRNVAETSMKPPSPEVAQSRLDAMVVEVRICSDTRANVIARVELPGGKVSYSVRGVELEDGRWLNWGESGADTLDGARAAADRVCARWTAE